jgi:hypothetical protein
MTTQAWITKAHFHTGGRLIDAAVFLTRSGTPEATKALMCVLRVWNAVDPDAQFFRIDQYGTPEIIPSDHR